MTWRLITPLVALAACASPVPIKDFGVLITPVKHYPPPGVQIGPSRWMSGWVRVPAEEAEGYRFELGIGARRQVDASAKGMPGYTIERDAIFYKEAARRFAEAELAKRGLCLAGVESASEVAADQRTLTPAFVVRCNPK